MADGHKACHLPFVVTDLWHLTKLEDLTVPNGHTKRYVINYLKTRRNWILRLTLAHKNYCVVTVVLYRRKLELKNALNRWNVKVLAKIPSTVLTKNKDCAHLNYLCCSSKPKKSAFLVHFRECVGIVSRYGFWIFWRKHGQILGCDWVFSF